MKARGKRVVALALAWDGSRCPVRSLPAEARAFLKGGVAAPSAAAMARLMGGGEAGELRICWVPRLQGGDSVLGTPFATKDGLRVRFRAARWKRFGDVLGVVYRRR